MIRTSVVVPAYNARSTLPDVLDALEPQIVGRDREAIVVESSGDAPEIERRWSWVRVVALPERSLPGRSRNIGARVARGDRLAFLDADAVPDPDWLDELERALTPDVDAVAGAVLNGTPRSPVGTAGYLLEFAEWLPRRGGRLLHAASCNVLVRRSAFEQASGFAEDIFPGEDTVLTFPFGARGRLAFAPSARVRHLNRRRFRDYLAHQRRLGVAFFHVCSRVEFPHRTMGRPRFAPLATAFRLAALGRRVAPHPRHAAAAVALLPILIAGVAAWGTGVARGGR